MSGANIFVIYASSSGSNVTLSPRTGSGHVEPKYNSGAQVTLLGGSGISNGVMTANIKCMVLGVKFHDLLLTACRFGLH
jgi:hypothetical protein